MQKNRLLKRPWTKNPRVRDNHHQKKDKMKCKVVQFDGVTAHFHLSASGRASSIHWVAPSLRNFQTAQKPTERHLLNITVSVHVKLLCFIYVCVYLRWRYFYLKFLALGPNFARCWKILSALFYFILLFVPVVYRVCFLWF